MSSPIPPLTESGAADGTAPAGLFTGGEYGQALQTLQNTALAAGVTLLVTGPHGVGKSTLCRAFATSLDSRFRTLRLNGALARDAAELENALNRAFALPTPAGRENVHSRATALAERIASDPSGRPALILIDDADLLDRDALGLLAGLATRSVVVLILFGKPKLASLFGHAAAGADRLELKLTGLGDSEVAAYLAWRSANGRPGGATTADPVALGRRAHGLPGRIEALLGAGPNARIGLLTGHRRWIAGFGAAAALTAGLLWWLFWWSGPRSEPTLPSALPAPEAAISVDAVEPEAAAEPAAVAESAAADPAGTPADGAAESAPTDAGTPEPAVAELPATTEPLPADPPETPEPPPAEPPPAEASPTASVPPVRGPSSMTIEPLTAVQATEPIQSPAAPAPRLPQVPAAQSRDSGLEWLMRQPQDHFTLQIAVVSSGERAGAFVRQQGADSGYVTYPLIAQGTTRYVIVQGSYASRSAAEAAADRLTRPAGGGAPWIRQFGELQRAAGSR